MRGRTKSTAMDAPRSDRLERIAHDPPVAHPVNHPEPDDEHLSPAELEQRTVALQAKVHALAGHRCARCESPLCGHGALLAIVLGYQTAPRCASCLATEHHETAASLCERTLQWIRRRDCFRHVWHNAGEHEGHGPVDRPACLFASTTAAPAAAVEAVPTESNAPPAAAASYDAGDLGCGDLVLELRFRLRELDPGAVLAVTARDPAAPVDLPAWCGLCGHILRHAAHPHYWIQRKRDPS